LWSLPDGRTTLVDEEGTCACGTSGVARATFVGPPGAGAGAEPLGDGPPRGDNLQGGCTRGRATNDDAYKVVG
jgi:hypothetical protein